MVEEKLGKVLLYIIRRSVGFGWSLYKRIREGTAEADELQHLASSDPTQISTHNQEILSPARLRIASSGHCPILHPSEIHEVLKMAHGRAAENRSRDFLIAFLTVSTVRSRSNGLEASDSSMPTSSYVERSSGANLGTSSTLNWSTTLFYKYQQVKQEILLKLTTFSSPERAS